MGCGIFFTSYFDLQQLTARLHYDKSMTDVSILYSTGIVPVYFKYIYLFGQVTGLNICSGLPIMSVPPPLPRISVPSLFSFKTYATTIKFNPHPHILK